MANNCKMNGGCENTFKITCHNYTRQIESDYIECQIADTTGENSSF